MRLNSKQKMNDYIKGEIQIKMETSSCFLCAKTQQTISIQLVTTQNINNATTSGGKRATQSVPITRLLEHQRPSK